MPALERHGHLKLDEAIRTKVLAMSAATIDRLLRAPRNATRNSKPRRVTPEIRRRVAVRTFADWNEPAARQHGNGLGRALWGYEPGQLCA